MLKERCNKPMINKSQPCKKGLYKDKTQPPWTTNDKIFRSTFLMILLVGIILKIYKMHCCGIIFDESFTLAHFGKNIHSALTSYINPNNNHVINSILICLAHKYLGFYEHFIRIPSLMFGILLTLSLAYIVYKTINSNTIRVLLFGLVSLNWFVFDLSFLARGYSIALGAIYGGIAIILYLLYRKIKSNHWWIPVVVIVLMNFLSFGSMLSCISVLFSVNCVFILFYCPSVLMNNSKKLKLILLNGFCISLFTFVSLYCLYSRIYKDILRAKDNFGTVGLAAHLNKVLVCSMNGHQSNFGAIIYYAFVFLAGTGFLFCLYKLSLGTKRVSLKQHFNPGDSSVFILAITGVSILSMFIYSVFLNLSLGYMRNSVFLLPLVLISTGIFLDRFWHNLEHKKLYGIVIKISIVVVTGLLLLQNLPSVHTVEVHDWDRQGISGPLLRKLKNIAPDKTWKIRLSKGTEYNNWPLLYYLQFDYKFQLTRSTDWDIAILYKTEKIPKAIYLDEYYFRKFNCYVIANYIAVEDVPIVVEN